MSEIAQNFARLKEKIALFCQKAHREPDEIKIVAATKTVDVRRIVEAVGLGITDLGENRVQELVAKYKELGDVASWHMIGHLQTNKVKHIIGFCKLIHSVDSFKLASEISRQAVKAGRTADILIQSNVSGEETKSGVQPEEVTKLISDVATLESIKVLGFMTIAPLTDKVDEIRVCFRKLKDIFEEAKVLEEKLGRDKVEMKYLSMGMTSDYQIAIEEGANMVRIGSAIFGPRR
jgi:pyridoxal phosphate enzyme (YggS family)